VSDAHDATGLANDRAQIQTLIARSARRLDAKDYAGYIALFAAGACYVLEADSAEIGRRMTWLELDRDELDALLEESPQHVHDLAARTHMVAVDDIVFSEDAATAASTFSVFRTDQAGVTEIYAVGHYDDRLVRAGADWLIQSRRVNVQTRMFRTPTPMPL
jgi:3-phenylpropionate/cinnamic acid dioxygenase small subunit